jgi:hypothetical protein
MPKSKLSFNRDFQIWAYSVSHGRLLLRSCKSAQHPTRIDVLFTDVQTMEVRANIQTISIEEVNISDVVDRSTKPKDTLEPGQKVFLLKSIGWTGCIVAGSLSWHEDNGEYGQPSVLCPERF